MSTPRSYEKAAGQNPASFSPQKSLISYSDIQDAIAYLKEAALNIKSKDGGRTIRLVYNKKGVTVFSDNRCRYLVLNKQRGEILTAAGATESGATIVAAYNDQSLISLLKDENRYVDAQRDIERVFWGRPFFGDHYSENKFSKTYPNPEKSKEFESAQRELDKILLDVLDIKVTSS